MDKKKLNNEIILCRPAVRKARVIVIRKLLKKMKILKSCKLEAMKDKKLKKAERVFEKVQIMKKIKDDDVTKFALKNNDLNIFVKGPEVNLRKRALASLAAHECVVKRVNAIREQLPNWEVELPVLLDSIGKKKQKKARTKNSFVEKIEKSDLVSKETKRKPKQPNDDSESNISTENISEISEKVAKIDDPFFIEKKVIVPKLVLESLACDESKKGINKSEKPRVKREANGFVLRRTSKTKKKLKDLRPREPPTKEEEEALHPSWAAKKVSFVKPFQGKRIMFSDD